MKNTHITKRFVSIIVLLAVLMSTVPAVVQADSGTLATHTGTVNVEGSMLRVRSGPSTSHTILGKLEHGTLVYIYEITDNNWYKIAYNDGYGYISGAYVINLQEIPVYDTGVDFETHLTNQQFPETYKVLLRQLHAAHPNWVFLADHLPMTWADAVAAESMTGVNLVQHNYSAIPDSWKSMAEGAYNWSTGSYEPLDGANWVAVESEVVAYYMEPRNFLNEQDIYLFVDQSYNPNVQTKEGLQLILNGTFMEGAFPEDTYSTYADLLMEAAQATGVSPYALAASILVEQGLNGQGNSISGTVSGYYDTNGNYVDCAGYYNHFNIRAWAREGMSAVQAGLTYAKGTGSYGRPWDTRAKSILGGAQYYADGYINVGQDTLYYKKFDMIGSEFYTHQYMTNIQGAYSENGKLASVYAGLSNDKTLTFNIPVYSDMPETNQTYLPTSQGANNYYITALQVNGTPVNGFYLYQNEYAMTVNKGTLVIDATLPEGATVSGAGTRYVTHGPNVITLTVTAASGKTATYTLHIQANLNGWTWDGRWAYYRDGVQLANQWMFDGYNWYYMDASGHCVINGWVWDNHTWYYMGESGAMHTGWVKVADSWYYMNQSGAMQTGWIYLDGVWYYANESGAIQTGWVQVSDTWYYMNESGGMQTGWLTYNGRWYFLRETGAMVTGWSMIGDHWYHMDAAGAMQTGWLYLDGTWYFLNQSGAMQTGWLHLGGSWYYASETGAIQTGWVMIAGTWYYMNESGAMQTGWQQINGARYYLGTSGGMQTGWVKVSGKWYYLYDNGQMATNVYISGGYINSYGVWRKG